MTPGVAWVLAIVLTFDTAMPPTPTWHATLEDCQRHAPVRVFHFEVTGRPVAYVACHRVRLDRLGG